MIPNWMDKSKKFANGSKKAPAVLLPGPSSGHPGRFQVRLEAFEAPHRTYVVWSSINGNPNIMAIT